jgi:2-succinyl-5-enolpyruvyl-6-hydroxy-3-cyclohexene-1-carboxylate synthase
MSDPNLNHLCARVAIEECVRRGCRTIVVCPGSRSAPLAAAAAAWRGRAPAAGGMAVDVLVAHDERGAAFLALGAARVTGTAAVVITTSGTAVANLLPAAVEASMDGIPMLLFTADRPPELHGCGANQSVPQAGMLAPVVRAAIDVACPDEPGASPLDALDAASGAWACAHGNGGAPGPVHVNFRFREPLAPVVVPWTVEPGAAAQLAAWQRSGSPWVPGAPTAPRTLTGANRCATDARWRLAPDADVGALVDRLRESRRGIVVAGGARSPDEAAALARIVRALRWPVIADITSCLRSDPSLLDVVHHSDLALCAGAAAGQSSPAHALDALRPDMILRIGARIASKRVQQWIDDAVSGGCALAVVGDGIEPMDPSRQASLLVRTGIGTLADRMSGEWSSCAGELADAWRCADDAVAHVLAECDRRQVALHGAGARITEPMVARDALREAHRAGAIVMLSSSMPVRDADMHADRDATPWCIANRGASGIDGIVATAAGACRAGMKPVLLLIGDVAALHDLASWALLRDLPAPMCVVVVNNDGGGIFRFLPIAGHPAIYSPWFDSPHGLAFEGAATMFSLAHAHVSEGHGFASAVRAALCRSGAGPAGARHAAHIIEVRTAAERIIPDHREIQAECARAVRDALAARPVQGSGR